MLSADWLSKVFKLYTNYYQYYYYKYYYHYFFLILVLFFLLTLPMWNIIYIICKFLEQLNICFGITLLNCQVD